MSHHNQHQHHHHHHHHHCGYNGYGAAHDHDHDHDHSHHHAPAAAARNTVADANRSFFDEQAATYDSRHEKFLERLTAELRSRLDFIGVDWVEEEEEEDDDDEDRDGDGDGDASLQQDRKTPRVERREKTENQKEKEKQVRLLDYACGTGMMSRALAPYVTQCVGIDLSENMVAAYNARARNQGLGEDEMFAVAGDLAAAGDPDPPALAGREFRGFELAVVGGGLHHFADPALAAARVAGRLRPGGVLLVWDFMPHGGGAEGDGDGDGDDDGNHGHGHGHGGSGDGGGDAKAESFLKGQGRAHRTITRHGFSEGGIREIYEKAGAGKGFKLVDLGAGFLLGHGHGNGHGKEDEEGEESREKMMRRRVFLARGEKV